MPAYPHQVPDADYRNVTSEYFKVFGIPIVRGRSFTAEDERANEQVAIVNQSFQRQFFPSDEVLGKRIRFLGFDRKPRFMTVVGVVPDVRSLALNRGTNSEVYANYFQHADSALDVALVVRGPANLQSRIERIVIKLRP